MMNRRNASILLVFVIGLVLLPPVALSMSEESLLQIKDTQFEEALTVLHDLGILEETEQGIRPDDLVTRAEAVAIVVRTSGVTSLPIKETGFSDVDVNRPEGQYISAAIDMKLIARNANKTFDPERSITRSEFLAILLRLMGYDLKAESMGGFPYGYLKAATELSLLQGIDLASDKPIMKGELAQIVFNALDKRLMTALQYGSDITYGVSDAQTLLSANLNLKKLKAKILRVVRKDDMPTTIVVSTAKGEEPYRVSDERITRLGVNGIRGGTCELYADENNNIRAIWMLTNTYYDYVTFVNRIDSNPQSFRGKELTQLGVLNAGIAFNKGQKETIVTVDGIVTADASVLPGCFARIIVDKESNIETVEAYTLRADNSDFIRTSGLITAINRGRITFSNASRTQLQIPLIDKAKEVVVVLNGVESSIGDLSKDMFFDCIYNLRDETALILVSSLKISEKVTEYNDKLIRIEDDTYYFSDFEHFVSVDSGRTYANHVAPFDLSVPITAFFDMKREIRMLIADGSSLSSDFYGVLIGMDESGLGEPKVRILRDIRGTGRELDYKVRINPNLNSFPGETIRSIEELKQKLSIRYEGETDSKRLENMCRSAIFRFSLDNASRICQITSPNWVSYSPGDYVFRGSDLIKELNDEVYTSPKVRGLTNDVNGKRMTVYKNVLNYIPGSNEFGRILERNVYYEISDNSPVINLTQDGRFAPQILPHIDAFGRNTEGVSAMIQGDTDILEVVTTTEEEVVFMTDLIVIGRGYNTMKYGSFGFGGVGYADGRRGEVKIEDDNGDIINYRKLNVKGIFSGHRYGEYDFMVRTDDPLAYDLYKYNIEDIAPAENLALGMRNSLRNKVINSNYSSLKYDKTNPAYKDYFLDLNRTEEVGNNSLVVIYGFNSNSYTDEDLRNVRIAEVLNLDKITTPGSPLGNLVDPSFTETVYSLKDNRLLFIGEKVFKPLTARVFILEYDPQDLATPYKPANVADISENDRVIFLYGTARENAGKGFLHTCIFQRSY